MAQIIDFELYKNAREDEKIEMKKIIQLEEKYNELDQLLLLMEHCVGSSFLIKLPSTNGQIISKEFPMDKDMFFFIFNGLCLKQKEITDEINQIQEENKND